MFTILLEKLDALSSLPYMQLNEDGSLQSGESSEMDKLSIAKLKAETDVMIIAPELDTVPLETSL